MNEQDEDDQEGGDSVPAVQLKTARLVLRPPGAGDVAAITEQANNRRVAEQTRRMPYPFSRDDAEEWIGKVTGGSLPVFLVTRARDGAVMGAAGCGHMDDTDIEVGYWVGEAFWGQGFATEALQAVIDHAFDRCLLERLYGRCRVANAASRRVLVKCGFQLVGMGMCDSRVLRGLVPVEEFVLERSVWESLKRWGKAS